MPGNRRAQVYNFGWPQMGTRFSVSKTVYVTSVTLGLTLDGSATLAAGEISEIAFYSGTANPPLPYLYDSYVYQSTFKVDVETVGSSSGGYTFNSTASRIRLVAGQYWLVVTSSSSRFVYNTWLQGSSSNVAASAISNPLPEWGWYYPPRLAWSVFGYTLAFTLHGCQEPEPSPSVTPSISVSPSVSPSIVTATPSNSPSPSASYSPLACGVRVLADSTGVTISNWISAFPQLHRLRTNQPNCLITAITLKLDGAPRTNLSAELRYNDDVPSGFNDGSVGKPGDLVPLGDQFHPVRRDNGDGTYTYFTTARPGIALPSMDTTYWLVLSLDEYRLGTGFTVPSDDDITSDSMYYFGGQVHDGRTGMFKLHGCCDRQPSPSPSASPSRVTASPTPSASPSPPPSPSPSPLACGVHALANTMGLDFNSWVSDFPQQHRLRTNRPNCLLTAFTVRLNDYDFLISAALRYNNETASGFNDDSIGKPSDVLVPQGDQFHPLPVDNGDGTYTFLTTARPGIPMPSEDFYWLVLSLGQAVAAGWTQPSTDEIALDRLYSNGGQFNRDTTAMLLLHGCCDLPPSPTSSASPSASPSSSSSPSLSSSPSPSPSSSFSMSPSPSSSPSPSPSPSPSSSSSPSLSPSPSSSSPSPSYSPLACGVRELTNTMGLEFASYYRWYPQLYRFTTNKTNCLITAFTVKLETDANIILAELRFDDGSPTGFIAGQPGKPGALVPQGDQFHPLSVANGNGTYTFHTTARPGVGLPSVGSYWFVLTLSVPAATGWLGPSNGDDIALDIMFFQIGEIIESLGGRLPMLKLHGCCDGPPSPSPIPTTTATVSCSPSPTTSVSPSNSPSTNTTPSVTPTLATRSPTPSTSPSISATPSATPSLTTWSPTSSSSPSISSTPITSPSISATPSATPSLTTRSPTSSPSPLVSAMPSATPSMTTQSPSPTPSPSPSISATPSTTPSLTTRSPTSTVSPSISTTPSATPSLATQSPSPTASTSISATPSTTPSLTTRSPTSTVSPSISTTPSATPSLATQSPSPTASTSISATPSTTPSLTTRSPTPSATPSLATWSATTSPSISVAPSASLSPITSSSVRMSSPSLATSVSRTPTPSPSPSSSPSRSTSPTPSTSPFALPVAIAPGEVFTNGEPDVELVSMRTSQITATTQCAGNIIVGLSGTGVRFSYFIRLLGAAASTATTTTTGKVVDMSDGATLAEVDVTAGMPTAANDSFTEVTAAMRSSSALVLAKSYWLPFCFTTTTATTRSLVAREEGSIGIGGVSASSGKTTVGFCSGGPTCMPQVQEGTLATAISLIDTTGGSGDSGDNTVVIAVGVAVPLALAVAGVVACVAAYIAYTRSKLRLRQKPPARRRSSVRQTALEQQVQRLHENDMFEMEPISRENQRKLNKGSWLSA